MKFKIYNWGCIVLLFVIGACQTSIGPYITTDDSSRPDLEDVTNSSYTFTEEDADEIAETFTWTEASFGYNAAVQYDVQLDFANNNFESPVVIGSSTADELEVTVAEFNDAAGLLGVPFDTSTDLEVRVMARAKGEGSDFVSTDALLSDTLDISLTSYEVVIVYPKLYVPGDYQASYGGGTWDITNEETTLESEDANDSYEGYLYFSETTTFFKISDIPDWANAKGDDDNNGVLNEGDNAEVSGSGYYKFNVNWATGVYTTLATDWGVIGSSTPGGWDVDTDMTFDVDSKLWIWTGTLSAGELKFRANDDWTLNYGLGSSTELLEEGSSTNIPVSTAGSFKVSLDLNQLPYVYTIEEIE